MLEATNRTFSRSMEKELGVARLKLLIAVNDNGEQVFFVSEADRVVPVGPERYRELEANPPERGNEIYDVTYDEEGKKGWCFCDLAGKFICVP